MCGFLGLHAETGKERFLETALELVDQVHHVLGRHRDDDLRTGWISGLEGAEAEDHPTAGGLRIGKSGPERPPGEAYDPSREWDRDGQYYHYLTKWMHALNRAWSVTESTRYHRWAVELARVAHEAFVEPDEGRIHWKMSVDLSRPLVPSMGQHDPLDGRITAGTLQATAPESREGGAPVLERECEELEAVGRERSWGTADPLGVGGLLTDCLRLVQLRRRRRPVDRRIHASVFRAVPASLSAWARSGDTRLPAGRRLAFRELGLAIGLRAAEWLMALDPTSTDPGVDDAWLGAVRDHASLADTIEAFWSEPEHRRARSWTEHRDINDVMLAVARQPEGYLAL